MYQEIEFTLQAILSAGLASGLVSVVAGFFDLFLLKRGFRKTYPDLVNICSYCGSENGRGLICINFVDISLL